jgi:hypothetical protein
MEFYERWDIFSEKMVCDLCREDRVDATRGSGILPSPALFEDMIDLCYMKLLRQSVRKSDLGRFLRHKVGKIYRKGWLKLILKRMHALGLIQSVSSDIIRRRACSLKK